MRLLLITLIISNLFFSCEKKKEVVVVQEEPPTKVKVEKIVLKESYDKLSLVGQTEGNRNITVFPDIGVNGIIRNIKIDEGSNVKRGTSLMLIDQRAVTGYRFKNFIVRAKISGVVSKVYVENGDMATAQTKLCEIVQMDKVKLFIDIPERDIAKIQKGQQVNIFLQSYPREKFSGQLGQVFPSLDPNTQTLRGEVTINNPQLKIKPGMFAEVEIILKRKKAILIPKTAMLVEDNIRYVYLYDEVSQTVSYQVITVGDKFQSNIEVTNGLKPGDILVVDGNHKVADKDKVQVDDKKS